MRETLRLSPTAPLRTTIPLEEGTILIGGDGDPNNPSNKRYLIPHDAHVVVQSAVMMRDVSVWGEDANGFRPERMLPDENGEGGFDKLPVSNIQLCF
jgi:cytochrome P450/NADPH-cytochrome P450 reductase